jgi:hypothetical protein
MATIHAPNPDFTGTTLVGPVALQFQDGAADLPDEQLTEGLRAYFQTAGYGVDTAAPALPDPVEPADPRDVADPTLVGSPARDAAVDPHPDDFLAPVNAGQANPHGPQVVSPGIHAIETLAVVPGPVGKFDADGEVQSDTDAQEAKEKQLAADVLAGSRDVGEATRAVGEGTTLPPKGNASTPEWREYARTQGKTPQEVDAASRDEIRGWFTTSAS